MTPKINWKPENQDLRKFGWTILIGFGVIAGVVFFKGHRSTAVAMWSGAAGVWAISMVAPVLAKPFYWVWMGIALIMGSIMSRVMLSLIFFLVITPVAIVFKLMRRDALRRRKEDGETYWVDHPKISDPKYYEHLS